MVALVLGLLCPHVDAADATFTLTDAKAGAPVADAVVSLVPLDAPLPKVEPGPPIEVVQKDKWFLPEVSAILAGTTVNFSNRERRGEHHVYSISEAKKFEVPLHKPGNVSGQLFDQPGVVAVGCNIHDWMQAYIVVVATPWFAKTGANGTATVAQVPPGRYRAEVWHARLKTVETRELTLPANQAVSFTLALAPDQRIRRGPTAAGGGYK